MLRCPPTVRIHQLILSHLLIYLEWSAPSPSQANFYQQKQNVHLIVMEIEFKITDKLTASVHKLRLWSFIRRKMSSVLASLEPKSRLPVLQNRLFSGCFPRFWFTTKTFTARKQQKTGGSSTNFELWSFVWNRKSRLDKRFRFKSVFCPNFVGKRTRTKGGYLIPKTRLPLTERVA